MIPDIRASRKNREIRDRRAEKDPRYLGRGGNADYYDDGQRKNYERYNNIRHERYDRDYDTVQKEKPRDYEEVRRERYERDIGKRDSGRVRDDADSFYKYDPNRKPLVRSPPPRYSTLADTRRDLGTPIARPHRY